MSRRSTPISLVTRATLNNKYIKKIKNLQYILGKRHFAPLIYPRPGNIPPNVSKFRYDPPELANAWQKIQSVHSPVCLDGKSITCVARDCLRHITYPKYPRLIQPLSCACLSFSLCFLLVTCVHLVPTPQFSQLFFSSPSPTTLQELGFSKWASDFRHC
jgi:hypothetical protein